MIEFAGTQGVRSDHVGDQGMADEISMFVHDMPERVEALACFWRDQRLRDLLTLTAHLRRASAESGFGAIGAAAGRLEKTLATSEDLERLRREVDQLVDLCRRVTV